MVEVKISTPKQTTTSRKAIAARRINSISSAEWSRISSLKGALAVHHLDHWKSQRRNGREA
jgi:hypothetical protein